MNTRNWMIGLVVVLLIFVLQPFLRNELKMDACLDRGGRWNEQSNLCDSSYRAAQVELTSDEEASSDVMAH